LRRADTQAEMRGWDWGQKAPLQRRS